MDNTEVMFSQATDVWGTPQWLFDALDKAAEIADSHATCEGIGQRIAVEIRALKEKE